MKQFKLIENTFQPGIGKVWKINILGQALYYLNKYLDALRCFDEAMNINNKLYDIWYWKGINYELSKDWLYHPWELFNYKQFR